MKKKKEFAKNLHCYFPFTVYPPRDRDPGNSWEQSRDRVKSWLFVCRSLIYEIRTYYEQQACK